MSRTTTTPSTSFQAETARGGTSGGRPRRPGRVQQTLFLAALASTLSTASAGAVELLEGRLKIDIFLMEAFQAIEADSGAFEPENTDTSAGFQRLRFNLQLTAQITEHITGFVDLAEEPNDFGGIDPFSISQDLGFIDIGLLGMYDDFAGSRLSERNEVLLRVGNLVTTVFNFRGFSDGAEVQANPLIGNSPADMVTAESGIQLRGTHMLTGLPISAFNWDVGVSVPTFFEDFGPDRGFNVFGRLSTDTVLGLSLGFGWFVNDLGDQVGKRPFGDIQTAEMLFGDGENYNFPGSDAAARDTHSGLLPGLDATVFHVDGEYEATFLPFLFRGWFGYAKDEFSFVDALGNRTVRSQAVNFVEEESKERFFGLEGTYFVIPDTLYAAARYTRATNRSDGVDKDRNKLDRIQAGGGWWFAENSLVKFEYVNQNEEAESPGQIGNDWDGVMAEVSFRF